MPESWQPAADRKTLRSRAALLATVRNFMLERNILEVDTPVLSPASIPDPDIHSMSVRFATGAKPVPLYLSTSPEFYMKRLLASGSGAIYQIARVFRDGDIGRWHQPEFSMLEWYRPGFGIHEMMQEVSELLARAGYSEFEKSTYQEVFLDYLDLDPHTASLQELQSLAGAKGLQGKCHERSILLEFLFSHSVAPGLGITKPMFVYNYPACQAALSRLSPDNPELAERFELFIRGMELANGFHELADADEQRRRFESENQLRIQRGLAAVVIDEALLSALQAGLPDCAGVAVGLDRLLMMMLQKQHINEVMTFPMAEA